MFTGLIQSVCTIKSVSRTANTQTLSVDLGPLATQTKIGDSIAVSGVCLTIAKIAGTVASFDVSGETLTKSTLGSLKAGSKVNIEQAMGANDRFGGHFVLGHVDGTAIIKAVERRNEFAEIKFKASPELLEQMVIKGSVAIDGISLTIANLDNESFTVAIIPKTLEMTTLGSAKPGDFVNIETDILVKAVAKQLKKIISQPGLTEEKLRRLGF